MPFDDIWRKSKVLIVEDDPLVAHRTLRRVEQLPNIEVALAGTAADADALLKANPFDLILLDINLPDADGPELLENIRRSARESAIIVVSGDESRNVMLGAFHTGVADYLVKTPGYLDQLPFVVRRVLWNRNLESRIHELATVSARRAAFLSIVDEVARAAARSLEPVEVLAGFVRGLAAALPCEWAALLVRDGGDGHAALNVFYSLNCTYNQASLDSAKLDVSTWTGGMHVLSDADTQLTLRYLMAQTCEGLSDCSVAVEPYADHASQRGFILIGVNKPELNDDEVRLLQSAATHAALAIDKALVHQKLMLANDRLIYSEKMRALGVMAAGVAHDFNNRLTVILSSGQILTHSSDAETAEIGRFVCEAAQSAAATVRRIRQYTGTQEIPELAPLNVARNLQRCCEMTRPHWSGPGPRQRVLTVDCPPNVWALAAEDALMDTLTNLVTNAVQATEPGGQIHLRAYLRDSRVVIEVEDNGPGVPQSIRERIFEPFFTTRGVAGQGLGLSVAQGLMRAQGGDLILVPTAGRGATFAITLAATAPEAEKPEAEAPSAAQKARVLVVDDEALVGRLVRDAIRRLGHSADFCQTAREALAALAESTYDIVLTDYGMPEMDGLEFAKEVRARGLSPVLILLTGWGDQEKALSAQTEIAAVLTKPVTMAALGRTIAQNLAPRAA